jgi:ATP-dependent exoDNAse (exonuclease V) beta subunit
MTIHKSKGLEFDVVVLADASRQANNRADAFLLLPETGLALRPDLGEGDPLAFRLARAVDRSQSEAESCRWLYVALTRAREKVLVSGHVTDKNGRRSARGWLKELLDAAGIDLAALDGPASGDIGVVYCPEGSAPPARVQGADAGSDALSAEDPQGAHRPIFAPLGAAGQAEEVDSEEEEEPEDWRVSGREAALVGKATGQIVHSCIQRWRFPGEPFVGEPGFAGEGSFAAFLDARVREQGLFSQAQAAAACAAAETLLARLRTHPLWQELDGAELRRHEVPYSLERRDGAVEVGYVDVLYRRGPAAGWQIVDFKTDTIQSEAELRERAARYQGQMRRYVRAVERLLGRVDGARMCFLDDRGEIRLIQVS